MTSVNDSFISRLPEEDRLAIQASSIETAEPAPRVTPGEALEQIQSNPAPSPTAAARFGPEDQQAVYQSQLTAYHQEQAALAEQALENSEPSFDDFDALPPIVARAEYDSALAEYNADPAVRELRALQAYEAPPLDDVVATPEADTPTDLNSLAQQAVADVHALPLPDTTDMSGLPPSLFFSSVYRGRVAEFNAQRAESAQMALDGLRPTSEELQAMHPTQAQYALDDFNSNPYVAELERIVAEAQADPYTIPAYLRNDTGASQPDVNAPLTTTEVREGLSLLGIDIPENASPATFAAGQEILDTLPDFVLGPLISPGTEVSFETPIAGLSTPGFLPYGGGAQITVEGEVELGDVQTGLNFEQTQRFDLTVQTRGEVSLNYGASRTTMQRIINRLDGLSPQAQELLDSSPLLDRVLRGRSSPITADFSSYAGAQLNYQAVVTPEQGARLADGDTSVLPNPLDPLNMAQGTGVLIEGASLEGSSFELTARLRGPLRAIAEGSTTTLDGYGFSVTRLEGSLVEVQAGPMEAVEHDLFLGLGTSNFNFGVGTSQEFSTHDVQIARIDLSTEEGQQAYQAFISTGQVPDWSPPGVQASGVTSVYASESSAGLEANAGGLSVNFEFGSHDYDARWTNWQDGSRTLTDQYISNDNHTALVTADLDPQGELDNAQWTIVVSDVDGGQSGYLAQAMNNGTTQFDQDQHVQLSFTSEELMQLRSIVREGYEDSDHGRDLLARLDADPDGAFGLNEHLAATSTPEEVWDVISNPFWKEEIPETFLSLSLDNGGTLPGTLNTQTSN